MNAPYRMTLDDTYLFNVTEKVEVLEARILDEKITLNGLACYQNYSIRVAASTKAGDGLKSRSIYCRTKEDRELRLTIILFLGFSPRVSLISMFCAWDGQSTTHLHLKRGYHFLIS